MQAFALDVQNIKCGGCANTIRKTVAGIDQVDQVEVDVEAGQVSFQAASEEAATAVKKRLASLGYPAVGDRNSVLAKASSVISCATGRLSSSTDA